MVYIAGSSEVMSGSDYQSSIYSFNTCQAGNSSLETLVAKERPIQSVQRQSNQSMAGQGSSAVAIEPKKSYGIGGAGNIRRPSDVIYPTRNSADDTHRRPSVWSTITPSPGSSPDGKRATFMNLFRKSSVSEAIEAPNSAVEREGEDGRKV